jgi:catechol 2,3-dioxygenase-like lactoylglutathione lyase family enzyme
MGSLAGVNHITILTSDLDRLVSFYQDVFGARKLMELPVPEREGPGRHALITLGGDATLHAFELSRTPPPPASPMFQRGRIDHFALNAADADTFAQRRDELLARERTDGEVTDFGVLRVLPFTDPDGHSVELAHWVGATAPEKLENAPSDGRGDHHPPGGCDGRPSLSTDSSQTPLSQRARSGNEAPPSIAAVRRLLAGQCRPRAESASALPLSMVRSGCSVVGPARVYVLEGRNGRILVGAPGRPPARWR